MTASPPIDAAVMPELPASPGDVPVEAWPQPAPPRAEAAAVVTPAEAPAAPIEPTLGSGADAAAAPVVAPPVDAGGADEPPAADDAPASAPAARVRKRPRPGERRVQILQTLAQMLEQPGAERITTAALAARLKVSEAALYRHFASKAQMFEGLIEFIESSVFTLINQVVEREGSGGEQSRRIVAVLLQFGEKNPGMTRVMVGDALVFEHERLTARMNQFFDRVESQLRQSLRLAAEAAGSATPTVDAQALASALTALAVGRLQRYTRSGFKRLPTEHLDLALLRLSS
jgi:TetR/AcrR family transcriptional regulator